MKTRLLLLSLLAAVLLPCFDAAAQESVQFASRDTCDLYMDIFRPSEGADLLFEGHAKPTVMFVFGGGFIMGERTNPFLCQWFQRLCDNGYAVVTIDYRLGMKGYKMGRGLSGVLKASSQFYQSQQMGVEDVFSAVAYLASHDCGIDVSNLVLAGSSAGAIISLAAEYEIACGRGIGLPEGFNFRGLMSFAGGIISLSGAPRYPSAPCPTLLLHGTADHAVAYKKLGAFGRGIWGSAWLADHYRDKGFPGWCIYRFEGRSHDVAAHMNFLWDIERTFLEQNVILSSGRTVDALVSDPSLPTWYSEFNLDNIYHR